MDAIFDHNHRSGNGFRIIVGGYTLSVTWEVGTYSSSKSHSGSQYGRDATTVEIAVIDPAGNFVTSSFIPSCSEDVKGHATLKDVLTVLNLLYLMHGHDPAATPATPVAHPVAHPPRVPRRSTAQSFTPTVFPAIRPDPIHTENYAVDA